MPIGEPHPPINPGENQGYKTGNAEWDAPAWDGVYWVGVEGIEGVEFRAQVSLVVLGIGTAYIYDDPSSTYDEDAIYADADFTWLTVTSRLEAFNHSRGRDRLGTRMRPGRGSAMFSNDDGLFNPQLGGLNVGGQQLRPGRAIRFQGKRTDAPDDEWISIWSGVIQSLGDVYTDAAHRIQSRWNLVGFEAELEAVVPPPQDVIDPASVDQTADERARYIWESLLEYPPSLLITEPSPNELRGSTFPGSRYEQFQLAADAEGGVFYQLPDGKMTWRNRAWLGDTVKFSIGTPADEIGVLSAETSWDQTRVRNIISMQRQAIEGEGTPPQLQTAVNTESAGYYGIKSFNKADLQNNNDADVLVLANEMIDAFAWDSLRLDAVTVWASTMAEVDNLLGVELGDRILIQINTDGYPLPWSYTIEAWVNAIEMNVSPKDWGVTLRLDNTDRSSPLLGGAYDLAFDPLEFSVNEDG